MSLFRDRSCAGGRFGSDAEDRVDAFQPEPVSCHLSRSVLGPAYTSDVAGWAVLRYLRWPHSPLMLTPQGVLAPLVYALFLYFAG
jgi:hypothetical protein